MNSVELRPLSDVAEFVQASQAVCPFPSNCRLIRIGSEWMQAGDIGHPIENNEWSDRVCLKNGQVDQIVRLV